MSPTLSTPSSEASSSATPLTSPKQHRTTTRATLFLITLTLACCLLSTYTTSFSLAAPASKPQNKNLLRQRSLAHQVHHVQVADESVHNTVVLLKKSIQKRKSQKRSQPQQQQQGHTTTMEKKRSKRHGKREIVDSSFSTFPSSAPGDHGKPTASEGNNDRKDVRVEALVDLDSIATTSEALISSSISDDNGTIQQSNKHKKKVQKKQNKQGHHRARLLSAYESIIFSESQIPVFLTQDHHQHHPQQHSLRSQHRRRLPKGAEKRKNKNPVVERHQNPIRANNNNDAEASIPPFVFLSSSGDDDVAVAQADSPSSLSFSSSLDSGLEQQQQHATTTIVAQDSAFSASNNNNLQNDHVAVGVTIDDGQSENDDKNSSLLTASFAAASSSADTLQVEDNASFVPPAIAAEKEGSSSAGGIEAVAIADEASQGADYFPSVVAVEEPTAVVIENESTITTTSITVNDNEIEDEDGWVTISNVDLVSDSDSNIDPLSVEFQSPVSDDIPFSDTINDRSSPIIQHHQRATGTLSLFHNGRSSSSVITLLGGLLLAVIGLVYRFHIRRQRLEKQQARRMGSSLPLDAKAPLSGSSTKSVHRLSVDGSLKREGAGGESARTTAMSDYVGFNIQ